METISRHGMASFLLHTYLHYASYVQGVSGCCLSDEKGAARGAASCGVS